MELGIELIKEKTVIPEMEKGKGIGMRCGRLRQDRRKQSKEERVGKG